MYHVAGGLQWLWAYSFVLDAGNLLVGMNRLLIWWDALLMNLYIYSLENG